MADKQKKPNTAAPAGEEPNIAPENAKGEAAKRTLSRGANEVVAVAGLLLILLGVSITLSLSFHVDDESAAPPAGAPEVAEPSVEIDRYKKPSDRADIDFAALRSQNADVVAWIEIPGTNIDYAVVHTGDNEYYLNNNAAREPDDAGAIYIDFFNRGDFSDANTVIYGHNKFNGTMFTQLHEYESATFFEQNDVIKIHLPDGMYTYRVFAAYKTDDANFHYRYDFGDAAGMAQLLADVAAFGAATTALGGVEPSDRILTLSTCVFFEPRARFVVHAVLVE